MTDAPVGRSAAYTVLTTGYTGSTGPGVAATVSYISTWCSATIIRTTP